MKTLEELRIEFADSHAMPMDGDPIPEELREAWAEHLTHYLPPQNECPMCGASLSFAVWGLIHGEMHCGRCSYPATMYHFVGEERKRLIGFLWAHPREVR